MTRTYAPALLSSVVETGDALHSTGVDFRTAFAASALANHAARHASPSVPSSAIVAANKIRPVVAGVPRYVSPSSVDSHALAGLALSYGFGDDVDPMQVQSDIIAATNAKKGFGVPAARKVLKGDHADALAALAALLAAVDAFEEKAPVGDDVPPNTDDETGDDVPPNTDDETASRITTGLRLISAALADDEEMSDDDRATFLAIFAEITASDAVSV